MVHSNTFIFSHENMVMDMILHFLPAELSKWLQGRQKKDYQDAKRPPKHTETTQRTHAVNAMRDTKTIQTDVAQPQICEAKQKSNKA